MINHKLSLVDTEKNCSMLISLLVALMMDKLVIYEASHFGFQLYGTSVT